MSQVVRQLNLREIVRLGSTCKALKGCFPPIKAVMIESAAATKIQLYFRNFLTRKNAQKIEEDKGSALTDSSQLTGALPMASGSYDHPPEQHPRLATLPNGPS